MKVCEQCLRECDEDFIYCPHCGTQTQRSAEAKQSVESSTEVNSAVTAGKTRPQMGCSGYVIVLVLLVIVVALVSLGGSGGKTTNEDAPARIGELGYLFNGANTVVLGKTKADCNELSTFLEAKDRIGLATMILANRVYSVPANTRALVLASNWGAVTRVRIMEGEHFGSEAWIPYNFVQKSPGRQH